MSLISVPTALLPEQTDFEWLTLDDIESAAARRAIAIWRLLRGDRRFPSRDAMTPRTIHEVMPNMSLVTVIDGGADFENRFVGDAVVRAHDVPIAHRRFSDIAKDMPALIDGLVPLFRHVVKTGEPLAYRGRTGHDLSHVAYSDFEGVLLPFGATDDLVDHIAYVGTCDVRVPIKR